MMTLGQLQSAVFIKRDNRFRAEIEINGERYKAHLPNSGRMTELLVGGAQIWVRKTEKETRKTSYDLVLVDYQDQKICLNAHLANDIFDFWLQHRLVPEFFGATAIKREQKWGTSRFDFQLALQGVAYFVEVKSVNLMVGNTARFPDAPTTRGTKHLKELTANQQSGGHSAVVFLVMGHQATSFAPNAATDPDFALALDQAQQAGVEVYAYRSVIDLEGITYGGRIAF